ncbi:MAG: response regulator transcription factor [Prevotellaceae bacterium]|jgi:DNA-binding NarL/FixJ family response regulator|nr:response regulator transcription factor [Prevotellaceae bacterium]
MITVHIADDHKLMVEALQPLINKSGVAVVSGVSYTLAACRNALKSYGPRKSSKLDILLLDIGMTDGSGTDFCLEVRKTYPNIKIIALTFHKEPSFLTRMMTNGASGYIVKSATSEEFITGIETVMKGKIFLCKDILNKENESLVQLTECEQTVLKYIAKGYTSKEISAMTNRSVCAIESDRKNIKHKYRNNAKNTPTFPEIIIKAIKDGNLDVGAQL